MKFTQNHPKSLCLMETSTISMVIFHSYVLNYQKVTTTLRWQRIQVYPVDPNPDISIICIYLHLYLTRGTPSSHPFQIAFYGFSTINQKLTQMCIPFIPHPRHVLQSASPPPDFVHMLTGPQEVVGHRELVGSSGHSTWGYHSGDMGISTS